MTYVNLAEFRLGDKIPHGLLSTMTPTKEADPLLMLWEAMTRLESLCYIASETPALFRDERTLGGLLLQLDDATKLVGLALETYGHGKASPDYVGDCKRTDV